MLFSNLNNFCLFTFILIKAVMTVMDAIHRKYIWNYIISWLPVFLILQNDLWKEDEVPKHVSKKVDCPAKIFLKDVIKFPDFKVSMSGFKYF